MRRRRPLQPQKGQQDLVVVFEVIEVEEEGEGGVHDRGIQLQLVVLLNITVNTPLMRF